MHQGCMLISFYLMGCCMTVQSSRFTDICTAGSSIAIPYDIPLPDGLLSRIGLTGMAVCALGSGMK